MSDIRIKDGSGNGYAVKVTANQKLQTESVVYPRATYFADQEETAYLLTTSGFVSLTSGESAVMYIKYTGTGHLHMSDIRTCGTGVQKWKMYKGSTGGTIISTATAAGNNNMNLSSPQTLSATVYKGADGLTQTAGTIIENWINNGGHSSTEYAGSLILAPNDVIVLTCEVSSGIDVCARILCYEDAGAVL